MELLSWIFWTVWVSAGVGFEVYTVVYEKRHGVLPLTRVVRDHLMRKFVLARLGVLLLLAWLTAHFILPLEW